MQVISVIDNETVHAGAPGEGPGESTPEAIRRRHFLIEACIKALGLLCLLDAIWGALLLFGSLGGSSMGPAALFFSATSVAASATCGIWLRALNPRGRLLFTLMAIVHLAVLAYETFQAHALLEGSFQRGSQLQLTAGITLLLVLAFLSILWSRRGRMVTSPHYRKTIIPATAGIKHLGTVPVLILLALLLIGAIGASALILAR